MAFGDARFHKCFPGLHMRNLAKSRRHFKVKLRKLRKRSKEHTRNMKKDVTPNAVEYVPISLARRAVLRADNLVNVEVMLAMHQMFKKEQSLLNEMIAALDDGSIRHDLNIWRMALQFGAEESDTKEPSCKELFTNIETKEIENKGSTLRNIHERSRF